MSRKLIIVLLVGGILYYWQQRSNFAIDQSKIPDLGLVYQEDLSIGNPPIQGALGESLPSNEHCHTIRGRLPRVSACAKYSSTCLRRSAFFTI
ncbi:MAG: hypothetical protein L0Y43_00135, partial [Methylococcaceae bacterium]|nr:hypothetical protein [Methylococcaceae bacterium]